MAPMIIGHPMDVAKMLGPLTGGSYALGMLAHFMLGTIMFPFLYMLVVRYLPGAGALRGALFMVPIYLIAAVVMMPMLGHPLFFGSAPPAMVSLMGGSFWELAVFEGVGAKSPDVHRGMAPNHTISPQP